MLETAFRISGETLLLGDVPHPLVLVLEDDPPLPEGTFRVCAVFSVVFF